MCAKIKPKIILTFVSETHFSHSISPLRFLRILLNNSSEMNHNITYFDLKQKRVGKSEEWVQGCVLKITLFGNKH